MTLDFGHQQQIDGQFLMLDQAILFDQLLSGPGGTTVFQGLLWRRMALHCRAEAPRPTLRSMPRRTTRLSDLGEQALIERIARRAGRSPGGRWTLGIGDDAALLRGRADEAKSLSARPETMAQGRRFANSDSPS